MKMRIGGFTLIELMVVISIISLLSSIVLASITAARVKASTTRNLAQFKEIQKAVELYYADNHQYPPLHVILDKYCTGSPLPDSGKWCAFKTALKPYMNLDALDWDYVYSGDTHFLFFYDSNADDNYQTYGMSVVITPNKFIENLAATDGGYWNDQYEVGQQPLYCMDKYKDSTDNNGIARDWFSSPDITKTCWGGD